MIAALILAAQLAATPVQVAQTTPSWICDNRTVLCDQTMSSPNPRLPVPSPPTCDSNPLLWCQPSSLLMIGDVHFVAKGFDINLSTGEVKVTHGVSLDDASKCFWDAVTVEGGKSPIPFPNIAACPQFSKDPAK